MREIRVYLDTNLISRMRDDRLRASDALALEQLSEFARQIQYVTSDKLTNEVARTSDPKTRGVLLLLAAIIEKVPWEIHEMSGTFGGAPFGALPFGGSWTDPIYAGLREIFDPADAHHVFLAIRGGCDHFLTLDRNSIIHPAKEKRERLSELCGKMTIVDPPTLLRVVASELKPK